MVKSGTVGRVRVLDKEARLREPENTGQRLEGGSPPPWGLGAGEKAPCPPPLGLRSGWQKLTQRRKAKRGAAESGMYGARKENSEKEKE